jgi:hypothetical protein
MIKLDTTSVQETGRCSLHKNGEGRRDKPGRGKDEPGKSK